MATIKWTKKAERIFFGRVEEAYIKFGLSTKLIYYYAKTSDIIHIVDIWDTLQAPENLKKRIKNLTKIIAKKFGSLGKNLYLCIVFEIQYKSSGKGHPM